jgi:hypothetical protein
MEGFQTTSEEKEQLYNHCMTEKEQVNAIAEIEGWKIVKENYAISPGGTHYHGHNGTCFPNYLEDLNVINRVEKTLKFTNKDIWRKRLIEIVNGWSIGECDKEQYIPYSAIMAAFGATARRRCEAILQTFNKWKD